MFEDTGLYSQMRILVVSHCASRVFTFSGSADAPSRSSRIGQNIYRTHMVSPPRRKPGCSYSYSSRTPDWDRLMGRLLRLHVLVPQPGWHLNDFERNTPEYEACKRRDWYEKAKSLPMHYEARDHYLQLLTKQVNFYERKQSERKLKRKASAFHELEKMEQHAKQAVQDTVSMAREQAKRTEEKIRLKKALKEFGSYGFRH